MVRVDENVTPKDRLSFNVYRYTNTSPNAVTYNSPLLNTTWDCSCSNAWLPSIDYTRDVDPFSGHGPEHGLLPQRRATQPSWNRNECRTNDRNCVAALEPDAPDFRQFYRSR